MIQEISIVRVDTGGSLGENRGGGYTDAFILKLNSSGVLQWVTQLGNKTLGFADGDNSEKDHCTSVTVDDSGNVYCAGYTEGALGEANGGGKDAFVMKLNSSGDLQWVTQLGDTTAANGGDNSGNDYCESVALDDSGNIYCAGYTDEACTSVEMDGLGNSTCVSYTDGAIGEANGGEEDAFILKLTSDGELF